MSSTLEERFDKDFTFTGIEHQLEGIALRQDLLNFIRKELDAKIYVDQSILLRLQRNEISSGKAKELIEQDLINQSK